jgi:hypothetical protein
MLQGEQGLKSTQVVQDKILQKLISTLKKISTHMQCRVWACLLFICFTTDTVMAQLKVGESGSISSRVYADYYWIAANHDADIEGQNGFWFRRIYFTYNYQLSESFSGRLRLEMNSEGDFETSSELAPTLKDAWLQWTNDVHTITAGIAPTPTLELVEEVWGYRSVEKSPLDLYDFGSSRDFGLSFKGNLDANDRLNYHFMFANGNSNRTELNKGKKISLALSYYFTKNVVIQGYGDWNNNPGNSDTYTAQGFLGYQSKGLNLGALYAYQFRNNADLLGDLNLDLVSLFTNVRLTEKLKTFVRVDHLFDRNPTGTGNNYIPISDQTESTFLTGGVDITLEENIHLIPNLEAIIYGENDAGFSPKNDLIPRLTLFFSL